MPAALTNTSEPGASSEHEASLADYRTTHRVLLMCGMSVIVACLGTLAAKALLWLIAVITQLAFFHTWSSVVVSPKDHALGAWVVLVPIVGALVIGLMARYGSEKIRGHGIPEALEAILLGRSRIQLKVALLKPLSSAISIGTGGPFGAEGPIIMTGGALGSIFAQQFHLSAAERKTLLVAGAAAGMSAVFATPVAAVLLAVELLLFEWRPRSFIPVTVASVTASVLRVPWMGAGPLFAVTPHAALSGTGIGCAALIGLLGGLGSWLLTSLVYAFEDGFGRLRLHWMWWPALGAVLVGIGGWIDPRVMGVGYELIAGMLHGDSAGTAVLGLILLKALVWSVALGSGTSGGVLAPLLIIGSAMGALVSPWMPVGDAGLWATVGMAAMMAGTMHAPLTAMIFAVELTQDFQIVPGLLAGTMTSLLVALLLMRRSILTEKLARRGTHITRDYSVDPFDWMRVRDVMSQHVPKILRTMKVRELAGRLAANDAELCRHQGLCIVDEQDRLCGLITRGDLLRTMQMPQEDIELLTVQDAGSTSLIVTHPEEPLSDALAKMLRYDIGRLPVVSASDPQRLLGYLGRTAILSARKHQHDEEHVRQRGSR